jgi:hypothetical protein
VEFIEGAVKVIRDKAPQLIHLDMLVFIGSEQMFRKLSAN